MGLILRPSLFPRQAEVLSIANLAARLGGGLLVLPLALRHLSPEEMAHWYILQSIVTSATFLEFSLAPAFNRAAAFYAAGGAELSQAGITTGEKKEANEAGLLSLHALKKKCFLWVSTFCLLSVLLSSIFLSPNKLNPNSIFAAALIAGAATLNLWNSGTVAVLNGCGYIASTSIAGVASSLIGMVAAAVATKLEYGVVGLAVGSTVAAAVGTVLNHGRIVRIATRWRKDCKKAPTVSFITLWPAVWKSAAIGLGATLLFQSQILVASRTLPSSEVASLGLSIQVVSLLSAVATVFVQANVPNYITYRVQGRSSELKSEFAINLVFGISTYALGAVIILLIGPKIIEYIGGQTSLIPLPMLVFLVFYRFLEFHHVQFAILIASDNRQPFVLPATISGATAAILYYPISLEWGLWGILIVPALVQATCNNWLPIIMTLRSQSWKLSEIYSVGLKGCRTVLGRQRRII
jgi:O-antigen/teichoic acid export membrane protein